MAEITEAEIRHHPSINMEPRTLSESTLQHAKDAAQDIMETEHPEPSSDIFTKDATDIRTRQVVATAESQEADRLTAHLDNLIQKAGKVVDANQKQSEAMARNPSVTDSEP